MGRAKAVRWLGAPGLWLGFGALFHAINLALLEVGAFALATLSVYLVAGAGPGAVRVVQRCARGLARLGLPVPKHMAQETVIAAEDPDCQGAVFLMSKRDTAALPGWAWGGAAALLGAAGWLAVFGPGGGLMERAGGPLKWWHGGWWVVASGLVVVGWRRARRAEMVGSARAWAYGPAGRLAAGGVFTYHLLALVIWQVPAWPGLPQRDAMRALVAPWMDLTGTRQAWSMFAPNPPRRNVALQQTIVTRDGRRHELQLNLQAQSHPRAVSEGRWRKIDDSIGWGRPELVRWHARGLCRSWTLQYGEAPVKVELARRSAVIVPLADEPAREVVEPMMSVDCASEPFAQLDEELRARHGLGPAPAGSLVYRWPKDPVRDRSQRMWWLLALALVGALGAWARGDRRRAAAGRGGPGGR